MLTCIRVSGSSLTQYLTEHLTCMDAHAPMRPCTARSSLHIRMLPSGEPAVLVQPHTEDCLMAVYEDDSARALGSWHLPVHLPTWNQDDSRSSI